MNVSPRSQPSAGQTFLVGTTIYFRPVELEDAATAAIWRRSPFPAPQEVVEEQLKERLEPDDPDDWDSEMLLISCRRDNDQPVGSVELALGDWVLGGLHISIDPLLPEPVRSELSAECITVLVPWMLYERHLLTVYTSDTGNRPAVARAVEALGGRLAVQQRGRYFINGERCDRHMYQIFNRNWLKKLGAPAEPVFGAIDRPTSSPARPSLMASIDDRPVDAMVLGERVYLRAFKPEEGKLVAQWALRETEIYYPEGRLIFNGHVYGHIHKKLAEKEPPEWLRFAIALRETGELIGCTGLESISWTDGAAETETEIFRPEHRNAGYGTEAKHLLLEYAFEQLGLHTIVSFVAETNTRSAAALRKQGYRDAGLIAWDSFCDDDLCGYLGFDLLADEWREARDRAASADRS
ncbi:MAG: GNAT family N-acetyltransferase [Thermomicrobiales bacterium]|nr:GNAT family N-acetyltransferase [Thermomicrobiales bacterium]